MSAIGGFLFGYDTGVVSGAMLPIKHEFQLTDFQQEICVTITIITAVCGAGSSGYLNMKYGRRKVILLSSLIFTIGGLMMGFCFSFNSLIIGRAIVGLGIGIASMTTPVYIAETAPSEYRGMLVTTNTLMITAGQFIAGMIDGIFANINQGWRYMLGLAIIPSIIQLIGFLYLPESPRWLLSKGEMKKAIETLQQIRCKENVSMEINEIKAGIDHEKNNGNCDSNNQEKRLQDLFENKGAMKALYIGCTLMILQQLAGINTVMYYSASIYNMAGFSENTSIWLAGFTSLAQFFGVGLSILWIEKYGRRFLLLISLFFVTLSLLLLGFSFYFNFENSLSSDVGIYEEDNLTCSGVKNIFVGFIPTSNCYSCLEIEECGFCKSSNMCSVGTSTGDLHDICGKEDWNYEVCDSSTGWLAVFAMVIYLIAFGIGMSGLPWTINSEIYPLHLRSLATSISTSCNWIGNIFVSATFLTISSPTVITSYGAFWLYAFIAAIGWIWIYYELPETKGLSLEEITEVFEDHKKCCSLRCCFRVCCCVPITLCKRKNKDKYIISELCEFDFFQDNSDEDEIQVELANTSI